METIGKYTMFAGQAIGKSIKSNAVYISSVGQASEQSRKLAKAGKIVMENSSKVFGSIGFGVGMYEAAYDDNKMSLQDKIDSLGHWIDETGKALAEGNRHLGQALQLKYGGLK